MGTSLITDLCALLQDYANHIKKDVHFEYQNKGCKVTFTLTSENKLSSPLKEHQVVDTNQH